MVALEGDLGSGKTELARAVVQALAGAAIEVPSPSFTLVQDYPLPRLHLYHADLYRLADPSELAELGLEEAWQSGALLVEWPERAEDALPPGRLVVQMAYGGDTEGARRVTVSGDATWTARLRELADDRA